MNKPTGISRVFFDSASAPITEGALIELNDFDAHHLRKVLRATAGDSVVAVDRKSKKEFGAVIEVLSPKLVIRLTQEHQVAVETEAVGILFFALSKAGKNDLVCEKAVELGVQEIGFWQAERSVVQGTSPERLKRWTRIAESAAKQSGKTHIPEVLGFDSLAAVIKHLDSIKENTGSRLCCSLSPEALPLRNLRLSSKPAHLIIGPEGGLTGGEEKQLVESGFTLVRISPYVLRAETAAIAALSMVHALHPCATSDATI